MAYTQKTVEFPIGGGQVDSDKMTLAQVDQAVANANMRFLLGAVTPEGAFTNTYASPITGAPTVLGGIDWWPTSAIQRTVVLLSDGTIKKDDGSGNFATTLASGLGITPATDFCPQFVEAGQEVAANNRKLFIFFGPLLTPRVLSGDGATVSTIATPPADWAAAGNKPVCGAVHEGRLWAAGNANDPHRVYYSTTGNHEDFTGAGSGSISVFPGEGERITGLMSYNGLLLVWKYPIGIYYIDTTDPTVTNWKTRRVTLSTGGVSPKAQVLVDGDILFLDAQGNFQTLSTSQNLGGISLISVTRKLTLPNMLLLYFDPAFLRRVSAVFDAKNREIVYVGRQAGNFGIRVVLDMNAEIPRMRFSRNSIDNESLWLTKISNYDIVMRYGCTAGEIKSLVYGWGVSSTISADVLTNDLDFSHIDPSLATKKKNAQFLTVVFSANTVQLFFDFKILVYWDGILTNTLDFTYTDAGVTGTHQVLLRKKLAGGGVRCQLRIQSASNLRMFAINRIYLSFGVDSEPQVT